MIAFHCAQLVHKPFIVMYFYILHLLLFTLLLPVKFRICGFVFISLYITTTYQGCIKKQTVLCVIYGSSYLIKI